MWGAGVGAGPPLDHGDRGLGRAPARREHDVAARGLADIGAARQAAAPGAAAASPLGELAIEAALEAQRPYWERFNEEAESALSGLTMV